MVGLIKMKLGTQVGLGPSHYVLDGDPDPAPPPPKGGGAPQFSAHICCSQMAGWIKMPLGMEVGLSPGDFVLDGNQAPLNFWPMFIIVIVISLEHCTKHSRYWFIQVQVQENFGDIPSSPGVNHQYTNPTIIHTRCMLYIKAGAASMARAWFIHWPVQPVCGLYGPVAREHGVARRSSTRRQ